MNNKKINDIDQLSRSFVEGIVNFFGAKCNDICVKEKRNTPMGYFFIDFTLYDYFVVICEYKQGLVSFYIPFGSSAIRIKNVQARVESFDMKKLLTELELEITLRIPDKYLQRKGWIR